MRPFDWAQISDLNYNLILRVEDECWESLDSMPLSDFLVLSGVNFGDVARRVLSGELLSCLCVFWSKFLAVAAEKSSQVNIFGI